MHVIFLLSEINGERLVCGLLVNEEIPCRHKIEAESILSLCDQREAVVSHFSKILFLLHKLNWLKPLKSILMM